jgi:hypothetical protein
VDIIHKKSFLQFSCIAKLGDLDAEGENDCLAHDNKKDKWRTLYNLLALDIFRRPLEMLLSVSRF